MASAANGGGTKMQLALAPVAAMACSTVSNMGTPRTSLPPRPGVTPPTTLVPYLMHCFGVELPGLPVMP
jgi:hypothetical protein